MYTFAKAKDSHFKCKRERLQTNVHTCVVTTTIMMKDSSIILRLLYAFYTEPNPDPWALNPRTNDGK